MPGLKSKIAFLLSAAGDGDMTNKKKTGFPGKHFKKRNTLTELMKRGYQEMAGESEKIMHEFKGLDAIP